MSDSQVQAPQIGTETGRMELVINDSDVDDYLRAMDMDASLYPRDSPGRRIAPPELAPKLAMMTLIQDYCLRVIGNNIRAKQAFVCLKPVYVGTRIQAVGKLVDAYERRGKQFVTFEAVFTDEAGKQLVIDRRTQLVTGANFKLEKRT